MKKKYAAIIITALLAASLTACTGTQENRTSDNNQTTAAVTTAAQSSAETQTEAQTEAQTESNNDKKESTATTANVTTDGAIDAGSMFTDRDMTQTAYTSSAQTFTLSDGQNISITSAGVYVLKGNASNVTVTVDAASEDKVQIVLDGASITNTSSPAVYVKSADKVFVTTLGSSSLSVTGSFIADGETNTDAVIFSKDDLVLNGTGTLAISSTENGISGKDTVKITGGAITIDCTADAVEANDSIEIADGSITINSQKDGLHAENDEDDSAGYVYICGGTFSINASDDGIHATTIVQIDGGTFNITGAEGIEATWVQINGGKINISASDDGINAANKSSKYSVLAEFNGGETSIDMGQGDTDGVDSNGDIIINGGTISVNGQSTFDYDGKAEKNGGTIIINGTETDTISNQTMGGGMGGGMQPGGQMQGGMGGPGGQMQMR